MTKPSSLTPLIAIAQRGLPFTAADGQAFVRLNGPAFRGHYILPVRSRAYRDWFFYQFFAQHETVPTANAFHAILNHLEAQAAENDRNSRLAVFRRVAAHGDTLAPDQILVDLANRECQYVDIRPGGWKISTEEGVLLQTSRSTRPLPTPEPPPPDEPPPLETLRACLNLPSRAAFLRCLAWLLAAFHHFGPFPFLILQGPPSSGKTFAARLLRWLLDPSAASLSPIPSTVRDLVTLARHNWILAFDHISTLSPPLTDALCRLTSGLGVSVHETTRPGPEPLLQACRRPVLLTVTDDWSCPAAIAERALIVDLPPIPPDQRRTERDLLDTFDHAWPAILGSLCSAVATALGRMSGTRTETGRCADALAWAVAASPALGCTEDEMRQAFAPPAPPHPMVEAVRNLLEQRQRWTGTATELLELLQPALSCHTPKGVSHQLKTCTLTLADRNIEVKFRHLHGKQRIIDLREESGGAWNQKDPPHAPPESGAPSQATETEELKPC